MPLPTDATISLLGSSKPGETSHTKPKQAMIVRLSDETLDMLESLPQLQFDFSENPGIIIGESFFPVASVPETAPHDLYLRTSSAAKRNAPLKLYANVIGKFRIERQLDERIKDKVRASAADAQNARAGRTTILVETPSELPPPTNRKKKDVRTSSMFRKPLRAADQQTRRAPASNPTPAASGTSSPAPSLSQRSKEAIASLRSRMIRCIAVLERTPEQVVKLVGGNDPNATMKRDILELLEEIAEPIPLPNSSKAPKTYRLKTRSWLEVRPHEYPNLSESDRLTMIRAARLALRDLKIPESDPVWSHFQIRNPHAGQQQTSEPPKRGITSASAKGKKTAKRGDTSEIVVKEILKSSSKPIPSVNNSNNNNNNHHHDRDEEIGANNNRKATPTSAKPPVARPPPGSGFKAKQPIPPESRDFAKGRSPVVNSKPSGQEKEITSSSASRKPPPPPPSPNRQSDRKPLVSSQKVDRTRALDHPSHAEQSHRSKEEEKERDRDRDRGKDRNGDKEKEKERERERDRREREREREGDRDRRERDRRERDRERERQKLKTRDREEEREDRQREKLKEKERERRELEKHMERERARRRDTEMESDRDYERPRKLTKNKVRERDWSVEREEGERTDDSLRPVKRKKVPRDDDDYEDSSSRSTQKKRKLDMPPPRAPDITKELDSKRRLDMKKEGSPLPSIPKIKKEPLPVSPLSSGPTKISPQTSTSTQASNSKPRVGTKLRQKTPIYTSSEDEGEIRPTPIKREQSPVSIPSSSTSSSSRQQHQQDTHNTNHTHNTNQSRSYKSKPLPTDPTELRARYDDSYPEYFGYFQTLMKLSRKAQRKLAECGDRVSITDSDSDADLLDPAEVKRLKAEHDRIYEELSRMRQLAASRTSSGSD